MRKLILFAYCLIFLFLSILFFPKENIYYLAEQNLVKYKVVLNNETLNESFGVLKIEDIDVIYNGANVAKIKDITTFFTFFYNKLTLKDAEIFKSLKNIIPLHIDKITAKYTIFYPTKIWFKGSGEFGNIEGNYNIYNKNIYLVLNIKDDFKTKYMFLLEYFKDINGELVYESTNR